MSDQSFDLIVIGAGPAGYVAAIRAAQLGIKTALVEKRESLGGTCLNVGCIPSKALLDSSEKFEVANHEFADHGIKIGDVKLDLKTMLKRKDEVVSQLTGGIAGLMKKNKVTTINGWATLKSKNEVDIDGGKQTLKADKILIAAGSEPVELPHMKFDGDKVVTSTDALDFKSVPKHLIVVGAGVIGLEMGSVWRRLGAKVTLVDIMDDILTVMDKDLGKEALRTFKKQGLEFELGQKVSEAKVNKSNVKLTMEDKDGNTKTLEGDKGLVAVGRRPNTDKLGLDNVGIKTDNRGFIQVDDHYKTSVDGIYAVGDCVPGPMLAHKGEEEGLAAVELMAGEAGHVNYNAIPWVVYTWPEIAGVGLTEQDAKEKGMEYKIGKFLMRANGRALAIGEPDGFVKVIADKKTDRMLGMHIIGANASEMIAEGAVAMEFAASAEDIARCVHAHPTMAEAMKEAASLASSGKTIHS